MPSPPDCPFSSLSLPLLNIRSCSLEASDHHTATNISLAHTSESSNAPTKTNLRNVSTRLLLRRPTLPTPVLLHRPAVAARLLLQRAKVPAGLFLHRPEEPTRLLLLRAEEVDFNLDKQGMLVARRGEMGILRRRTGPVDVIIDNMPNRALDVCHTCVVQIFPCFFIPLRLSIFTADQIRLQSDWVSVRRSSTLIRTDDQCPGSWRATHAG